MPVLQVNSVQLDGGRRRVEVATGLFRQMFTGQDAAGIWAQAQAQLPQAWEPFPANDAEDLAITHNQDLITKLERAAG